MVNLFVSIAVAMWLSYKFGVLHYHIGGWLPRQLVRNIPPKVPDSAFTLFVYENVWICVDQKFVNYSDSVFGVGVTVEAAVTDFLEKINESQR